MRIMMLSSGSLFEGAQSTQIRWTPHDATRDCTEGCLLQKLVNGKDWDSTHQQVGFIPFGPHFARK
jgi:hypothetical protein